MPDSIKIKCSYEINPDTRNSSRCVYLKVQKKIFLLDQISDTLVIYNNLNGSVERITLKELNSPYCICLGANDDLYISNEDKFDENSIVVFGENLKFKRKFKLSSPYVTYIEFDDGLLYVAEFDKITIWNSETAVLKNTIKRFGADFVKVRNDLIYVMNMAELFKNDYNEQLTIMESGSNAISILDKTSFKIINKIEFDGWLESKGLAFDNYDNIYTIAYELDKNKIHSEYKYLHIINKNHEFIQKLKILDEKFFENELITYDENKIMVFINDKIRIIEFEGLEKNF